MENENDFLRFFFEPVAAHLADESVTEVLMNGPHDIYIERAGKLERTSSRFASDMALRAAAANVAKSVGRALNEQYPRLDARLPDGSRVHAVIPPLSRGGTVVAIRKFPKNKLTAQDLVARGAVSERGSRILEMSVRMGKNILVSGATSSGKTTVLNVLSGYIPADQRILVLEDASELRLLQPHTVYFETRAPDKNGQNAVPIRDLIHSALRLRPDRLVIGEIRGGEALDLLQALNTGHAGSMSTIHANGPADALTRLETCAMQSGFDIPLHALRSQVVTGLDLVVHTARLHDGRRRITHISEVLPLVGGEYLVRDLYVYRRWKSGPGLDPVREGFTGTGQLPSFFEEAELAGLAVPREWFFEEG